MLRFLVLFAFLAVLVARIASSDEAKPVRLGAAELEFEWVADWPQLPDGVALGNTHGAIVTDAAGRVYVNTDGVYPVLVFEPDGTFVSGWDSELAGGLHGMTLAQEGDREVLYLVHTSRHELVKTTLDGAILWQRPWPQEAKDIYTSADQYSPTAVAVAPSGDLYVADGYGASWVHRFRADGTYVASFGGPGKADGLFRTCHGLSIDTLVDPPEIWVADRENGRLQVFDLDGQWLRTCPTKLRRPCSVTRSGDLRVVADLAGRVTVLDAGGALVTHLGDNPDPSKRANNGVPESEWTDGEFIAPHFAVFDAHGNLYVMDWVSAGRVTKLRRVDAR